MITEKGNIIDYFFLHYYSIAIFIQKERKTRKNIELVGVDMMMIVIISKDLHLILIELV